MNFVNRNTYPAIALAIAFFGLPSLAVSFECNTRQCFVESYKSVDPAELPQLTRVTAIYERLSRIVGSRTAAIGSKLLAIDSDGYPWALALSDNTVVVTKGAIQRMYSENDMELGDARAAYVLGHELSHIETQDLFHHRAFLFNQGTGSDYNPSPDQKTQELRADLRGFTFATLAGYETNRLLEGDEDLFRGWLVEMGGMEESSSHPDIETRRRYLHEGFSNILNDVPYYQFGVALAHFGHYEDAETLLEDSLNRAETLEAYANLGYVHLQRAREKMAVEQAYKYWIPTLLEPRSSLDILRRRSLFETEIPEQAMEHLVKAEKRLKYAIDIDETQIISHINLAAVYMYMPDKLHRAYAAIENAKRTPLGRKRGVKRQLESIYQLIRVNDDIDDGDRWPDARDRMAKIADDDNASENLLYNFARMLDERGRDNTARKYWERLHENIDALPVPYQLQVCFRLRKKNCKESVATIESPWRNSELPVGQDIRQREVSRQLKQRWSGLVPKVLPGLTAQVFFNKEGDSLIALDNYIEMMIVRNVPSQLASLAALQNEFGTPHASLPVGAGQLLAYRTGWSVLAVDEKIVEIWITKL